MWPNSLTFLLMTSVGICWNVWRISEDLPGGTGQPNPLYDASLNTMDKSGYEELTDNFSLEWNVLDGLTLRGQFGITSTSNHSDYFLPAESFFFHDWR